MRVRLFGAGPRSIWGVAVLTTREMTREWTSLLLPTLFWIYLGFYQAPGNLESRPAAAHYLEYALGGSTVAVLLSAALVTVGLRGRAARERRAASLAGRVTGPVAWYWGRCLGVSSMLLLLSIAFSAMVGANWMVRFGDLDKTTYPLYRAWESPTFESDVNPEWLRKVGDGLNLDYDVGREDFDNGIVRGRVFPRLAIAREGGPVRGFWKMRIRLSDPDSDWEVVKALDVAAGRSASFDLQIPRERKPTRLRLRIEKTLPHYYVKLYRRDVVLLGAPDSVAPTIMRAAFVQGLFAAVLAALVLFVTARLSWGPAVVVATGLVAVSTSLELIESSLLGGIGAGTRDVVLGLIGVVLPDFDHYDVAGRLATGVTVPWADAAVLLFRWLSTGLVGGLAASFFRTPGEPT